MTLTELGVWAIFAALMVVIALGVIGFRITRQYHRAAITALESMSDTHNQGFEGISLAIEGFNDRIKDLNNRVKALEDDNNRSART